MITLQQHIASWINCKRCPLCYDRTKVVVGRGSIPCDILFVGEAPGDSEDTTGIPFAPGAPAGDVLQNDIINIVFRDFPGVTYALTNILGCIPLSDGKKTQPFPEEIKTCQSRVKEFIELCKPKLLVTVGTLAGDHMYWWRGLNCHMVHPSWILQRLTPGLRPQKVIECRNTLTHAIKEMLKNPQPKFFDFTHDPVTGEPNYGAVDDDIPF